MKIALVIYEFNQDKGGAERACFNLAKGLLEEGHEIFIFAHKFKKVDLIGLKHNYVRSIEFPSALKYPTFASNLKKALKKYDFDIVHSFTRVYNCDVYRFGGGCHKKFLDKVNKNRPKLDRLISHINPKNRLILDLEKASFSDGAYKVITAVSNQAKSEIMETYHVPSGKIKVIYNGVATDKFSPLDSISRKNVRRSIGLEPSEYTLLFCSNHFRNKGLNFLLEALCNLQISFKLVIAGRGRIDREIGFLLSRLRDRAILLGCRRDMYTIYGACDVLVHPSLHDPFPNVCLEAMACGLPVITTRVTGIAEILSHLSDSYIIDTPTDVGAIVQGIKFFEDPVKRKIFGKEARMKAMQFSIKRNVDEHLELYKKIAR